MKQSIECVVLWFDRTVGDGWVKCLADGSVGEIYACNIKGKKTWYPETACVFYAEGEIVEVEVQRYEGGPTFIIGLTPGIFDAEKWGGLDHNRLAFKCDEDGKATTGLFGKGSC